MAFALKPEGQEVAPLGALGALLVAGPLDPSVAAVPTDVVKAVTMAALLMAVAGDGRKGLGPTVRAAAARAAQRGRKASIPA